MLKKMEGTPFPVMEKMTSKMVGEYLEEKDSIIVPIGITEQHGYHLPLGTDALIATHLARRIGEKLDILVLPTILQSFSGGNLSGTVNISPATMSLVVSDTLLSLYAQGFRKMHLLICHGGSENVRALKNAVEMLLRQGDSFKALITFLPEWKFDSKEPIGWLKAVKEHDWHAGWLETSIVMALEPDLVVKEEIGSLDNEPVWKSLVDHPDNYLQAETLVDDPLVVQRLSQRPDVKVGVMGFPQRASAEKGKAIVESLVETIAARIKDIESKCTGEFRVVPFKAEPLIYEDDKL